MIKLIIFDLDGVLVDAKKIHFDALNEALGEKYSITFKEHLSLYDGLKTFQKLEILSKEKNLPKDLYSEIWEKKQKITLEKIKEIQPNLEIKQCLNTFSKLNYKIAVCSNSIKKTIFTILNKLDIIEYFDLILSNEDVLQSKPYPEIYWKAMSALKVLPEETLIIEDSPIGLLAASRSGASVMRVSSPDEILEKNINKYINIKKMKAVPKWKDEKLNILIPMAGAGSRFEQAGYTFPKPLIEVDGKPMIQLVVENLNLEGNYIYVVRKNHREKYNLDSLLNLITPGCKIIETEELTEGAACTALLAKDLINNDAPLFFANSDQFLEWNSNEFMYKMQETDADGGIVCFNSTHPKWSFVKLNENGLVEEVAEKNPISNIATAGLYFWKKGEYFVQYAEEMIRENKRVNNEFYICPIFNEAVKDNKKIRVFDVENMWGLGTPEDLKYFIDNFPCILKK